ncbi:hypothetical protein KM869_18240, partial [Bacillus subtilis]|uniref:hypothetical protein n=1 Tax=Bacillus subtilis TaxID=1423 RepID=UPI001C214425
MEPLFHHSTSRPFYLDHTIFHRQFSHFSKSIFLRRSENKKRQTASASACRENDVFLQAFLFCAVSLDIQLI